MDKAMSGPAVVFELFGMPISETIVNTWIIMVVIIALALFLRGRMEKIPSGKQNIAEALVEAINNFTVSTMGERHRSFAPYVGTILVLILFCNLSGLFAMTPPTSDTSTTLGLAILSFIIITATAIKSNGLGGYLKGIFMEPIPILFSGMNILGELAKPVSLGFRLYGNILAGGLIMGMIYSIAPVLIPVPFHIYFDLFSGVLQTLIFTILTMVFVSMAG